LHRENETENVPIRRSQRTRTVTVQMKESLQQQGRELSFSSAVIGEVDALHQDDYRIQDSMTDPISFASLIEKDTMYFHEAMNAPDREEFIKAVALGNN